MPPITRGTPTPGDATTEAEARARQILLDAEEAMRLAEEERLAEEQRLREEEEEEQHRRTESPDGGRQTPKPPIPMEEMMRVLMTAQYNMATARGPQDRAESEPIVVKDSKGISAKAPESFEGKDPSELKKFLRACRVNFLCNPHKFRNDRIKVLYAGSYLSGVAGDWFDPYTNTNDSSGTLLEDWNLFEEEITSMFGDSNLEATAEYEMEKLRMKDHHNVGTYITKFRTIAQDLDWDDNALRSAFRRGLPTRVLDAMSIMDVPRTLAGVQEAAKKVDDRHWERERERKLYSRGTKNDSDSTNKKSSSKSSPKSSRRNSDNKSSSSNHNKQSDSSKNTKFTSKKKDPSITKLLNDDGKLKADEKARRAEKGLCSYCGGNHKLEDCKRKPDKAAGKVAHTDKGKGPELGNE